ncbi:MAG: MBL fold metallo-hydrolase [Luteitalea sp.]|nr:MBL fold metallo-hydrolase [Luteitalea sp.]
MKRLSVLAILFGMGAVSASTSGLQPQSPAAAKPVLAIQQLKDNLYLIETGSLVGPGFAGGNTAVLVTDSGVVVVDTKLAGWGQAMLEQIRSVTPKPVTMIINTHTHNDHTGSNPEFPASVEFVAHENTKANLSKSTCPPVTNCQAFKGGNAKFLPRTTFTDTRSLLSGKDRIDLHHFGPGHTNGDAFVVFPALRIMHAGDMFPWKDAPFLDRGNGGSGVTFPATLAKAVAGIKNVDTVIGGHLPPTAWSDFEEYQRFNQDILTGAQQAFKAGKSVDEAEASLGVVQKYKGYESRRVKNALTAIYEELGQK